jgi:hypothetical protein
MPPAVARPNLLQDPGFLWIAPLGTAVPANTVTAGVFSDAVAAAWLPLGATTEGSTFTYGMGVEPVRAAEFREPVAYFDGDAEGNFAFNLMNYTLTNVNRAMNGGVAALVPAGLAGSELTTLEPPAPGTRTRAMILWESTDATVRIMGRQLMNGSEISLNFRKGPETTSIPFQFNMEAPASGAKPWVAWAAGTTRV